MADPFDQRAQREEALDEALLLMLLQFSEEARAAFERDPAADGMPQLGPLTRLPQDFFDRLASETRAILQRELEETYVMAVLVMLLSDDLTFEIPELTIRQSASEYADARAREVATGMAGNVRQEFLDAAREGTLTEAATGSFDRARASSVAITETTGAISAGQLRYSAWMSAFTGVPVEQLWITEADDRVCPKCDPLHEQPMSVWSQQYPSGPPAHPRCRCHLDVRPVVQQPGV